MPTTFGRMASNHWEALKNKIEALAARLTDSIPTAAFIHPIRDGTVTLNEAGRVTALNQAKTEQNAKK